MSTPSILGIDLGTSNCAASVATGDRVRPLPLLQPGQPGSVIEAPTLPSAVFLPLEDEFASDSFRMPWGDMTRRITGAFARERGPLAPDRHITSAKSWLCHAAADREAPILPWQSEAPVEKQSPVEVSRLLLEHIQSAFRASDTYPESGEVRTVITLPASFDEAARALTLKAAKAAGMEEVILLEEPQAAFYAWTEQHDTTWRDQVASGDLVLVCDIGGGTADFSLIAVSDDGAGNLALERISVGEHILLGGDNLDLALAHALKAQLEAEHTSLDHWQFLSLTHAVRAAKETLLSDDGLEETPVAVAGRGSSLFASTVSTRLTRELLHRIALDGFLPLTGPEDLPAKGRATGLREFGLPYAADPVISKHLARFLQRSREAVASNPEHAALIGSKRLEHASGLLLPSAVLFNGGFFKASTLRARVSDLLNAWARDTAAVRVLEGDQPDLAVSLGAAVYGRRVTTGEGLRIKSSTARAYYLGLESGGMAIPGFTPPIQAVCVCPVGLEEGSDATLPDKEFGLVVGEPAEFRFFSSTTRGGDQPGDRVADAESELEETARMEVTLSAGGELAEGDVVPVRLETRLTDVGALELVMRHTQSDQHWQLEFTTRESGE